MKFLFLTLGILSLILGIIGIILPVMPTTPFILFTLYCFTKASPEFANKLRSSKIYKKYFETIVEDKKIPLWKKILLLSMVTIMVTISFIMVKSIILRITMILILAYTYYYFIFVFKNS